MQKVKIIGSSMSKVLQLNGAKIIKELYNGKDAVVETSGITDGIYYVKNFPKDYFYVIQSEIDKELLLNLGFNCNDEDIYPYNVLIKEKEKDLVYVVKPLDTLGQICEKFSLSKDEVIRKNNLKCENLFVGQRLIIDN